MGGWIALKSGIVTSWVPSLWVHYSTQLASQGTTLYPEIGDHLYLTQYLNQLIDTRQKFDAQIISSPIINGYHSACLSVKTVRLAVNIWDATQNQTGY